MLQERGEASWLYCLKDDYVIEAVRKVSLLLSAHLFIAILLSKSTLATVLTLVGWQMAQSNVGSLLVFDSTKAPRGKEVTSAAADAVVGIITERGDSLMPSVVLQERRGSNCCGVMFGRLTLVLCRLSHKSGRARQELCISSRC